MRRSPPLARLALLLFLAAPAVALAQRPAAQANDQRRPAGRLVNGELYVELEAVQATWHPRGAKEAGILTPAFAEVGHAPQVPGPLLRASVGTPVRVRVHNRLARPVSVRGLLDRATSTVKRPDWAPPVAPDFVFADSLVVPPGEWREVRFTPTTAVSSFYFGRVAVPGAQTRHEVPGGDGGEGGFLGALVVDPPEGPPPDERLLLLTRWAGDDPRTRDPSWRMMINGLAWPATEHLEYTVGDTVRWRVINTTLVEHPMHLHGFYFAVEGSGDTQRDIPRPPDARHEVVTERMPQLSAMRLTWVAERPGNWLFHCHLVRHMGSAQQFVGGASAAPDDAARAAAGHTEHDGMAGMITGITIRPRPGAPAAEARPVRRVNLWTGTRPGVFGDRPELGFVLQEGDAAPPPDSTRVPGAPIVLHRGEPTEIVVHNRLDFPLSLHWHGMELRSEYDGVGHWSGRPGATRAPIAPGDSQRVVIAAPRAGTFFYHTHGEPGHELTQGLYGPLLVLDPGEMREVERDRVFMLAGRGADVDAAPAINGREQPPPERFAPGGAYRLRFAQISADERKRVRLTRDGALVRWTPLAKDGADLPAAQRVARDAELTLGVGEAADVAWTPDQPGVYVLEVRTDYYPYTGRTLEQRVAFGVGVVSDSALRAAATGLPPGAVALSAAERARLTGSYAGRLVAEDDPREWLFAVWETADGLMTTVLPRGGAESPAEPITAMASGVFHPGGRDGDRQVALLENVRIRFVGDGPTADSVVIVQDGQVVFRFARRDGWTLTPEERAPLLGRYGAPSLPGPATVRAEGERLVLEIAGQPVTLHPLTPSRFPVSGPGVSPGAQVVAELEDGRVRALVLHLAPGAPPLRLERQPADSGVQSRFVDAAGVRLRYLDFGGTGVPLIFLHSESWDADTYRDFAPRFRERNRVLALTRRGYGQSGAPASGYDVPTQAASVLAFMDALGIDRAVLAGNSSPTAILTHLAEHHPERVAGLVYLAGLLPYWLQELREADPLRAGEMAWRAVTPAAQRADQRIRQAHRPAFLRGERAPIALPVLAFTARSGTVGYERFSEPLMLVGSPLLRALYDEMAPSSFRDYLEQQADTAVRRRWLAQVEDTVARAHLARLAADEAWQRELLRHHEAMIAPALVRGQARFRRAFGDGLRVRRLPCGGTVARGG